ncbi:MAG: PilN domain-containing protein, partial [Bdellovibrionales bacterium]
MIKINLLKRRSENTIANAGTEINYETSFDINSTEGKVASTKDAFLKILVIIIWAVALFAYESYNINDLKVQLQGIQAKRDTTAAEIDSKKAITSRARELQQQILDLEARIKAIRVLSQIRLREIKSIDYIQNTIPERVWLKSIDLKDGNLQIEGVAAADDQMNKFFDALESKKSFKDVLLAKAIELKGK